MTDLGDLPGGADYSEAAGINDERDIVGRSEGTTGLRAIVWDSTSGMQDLNDLIDPQID